MTGMMQMMLAGGGAVRVPGQALSDSAVTTTPTPATSGLTFQTNGGVIGQGSGLITSWYQPPGGTPGNAFWIKRDTGSGTAPSGPAAGTYTQLSSDVSWTLTRSIVGNTTWSGNYTISSTNSDAGIVTTGTMALNCTVNN